MSKKYIAYIGVVLSLILGLLGAADAKETLTFWSSGYPPTLQEWLRQEAFPKFEQKYNVIIDYAEIGWGTPREEKLLVAFTGGVFPDVFINGNEKFAMPLDQLIAAWPDSRLIEKGFWDVVRDRRTGHIFRVPEMAEVRGFVYNKRLFMEAGLNPVPPQDWQEMLTVVRRLTRLQDNIVTQSGFETVWGTPYVGSEYDWFVLQTGSCIHSPDAMTSTMDTDAALQGLKILAELYQITHPAGYRAQAEGNFARGQVAIARGMPSQLVNTTKSNPADVEFIDLYAPKQYSSQKGVSLAFVNGLSISNQTTKLDLAWEFVKYIMSTEVQTGLTEYGDKLAIRRDVSTNTRLPGVRQYAPWYRIMDTVVAPSHFPGRSAVAPIIVSVLQGKLAAETAIVQMQHAAQVALDDYWKQ